MTQCNSGQAAAAERQTPNPENPAWGKLWDKTKQTTTLELGEGLEEFVLKSFGSKSSNHKSKKTNFEL